jgi:prolyl-tRNA editing enzyme YbaK/EbsC (Cys-tRNA(Pro) deacylase)
MEAGGISALGLMRPANFDVLIDETAKRIETIHISAGVRGVELAMGVNDFVVAASARYIREMY